MFNCETGFCFLIAQDVSTGIGECFYAALMPLLAVFEVLVFAVTGCFNSHLPNFHTQKSAYTAKDFLRLAQETRCNYSFQFLLFFILNKIVNNGLVHFRIEG